MIRVHDSIIVQMLGRLLIPLVQLYAVYILLFGQYSPGGGFAAGVIFGASLILAVLVFGPESYSARWRRRFCEVTGLACWSSRAWAACA